MSRHFLLAVLWLVSLGIAYLIGRSQTNPAPPPADLSTTLVPAPARQNTDGLPRSTTEQLLSQRDWEAAAAQARADGTTSELLARAQAMAADGRVSDAIAMLDAYLQLDHGSDALFVYSDLLLMTGQMLEAVEPLFQILEYPETPAVAGQARQRLNLIINAYEQQLINSDDLAGLVQLFQQLALREPGYDRYRLKLAGWMLRSGDLEAAQTLARELGSNGVSDAEREALEREIALAGSSLPFQREGPGYFADVEIPAQRRDRAEPHRVRLLVDTGATTTSLGIELLQQLGARRLQQRARVKTANGVIEMDTYQVSGLRVGDFEIDDLVVLALPDPPHDADGLLGMDVLDQLPKPVGTP